MRRFRDRNFEYKTPGEMLSLYYLLLRSDLEYSGELDRRGPIGQCAEYVISATGVQTPAQATSHLSTIAE